MRVLFLVLLTISSFSILTAQSQNMDDGNTRSRSFLFEIGSGFSTISYDTSLDNEINTSLNSENNWDRITVPVHISIGYCVFQRDYITAGIDGIMDHLWKGTVYVQLNTNLYFLGYKLYPFRTGLYIEPRIGISHVIRDYDGSRDFFDIKPGASLSVAYDFAMFETGISASLGLKGMVALADEEIVEDKIITAGSIFISVLFK